MEVSRNYVMYPTSYLPQYLGISFYLPRSVEILDTYGGWTRSPVALADLNWETVLTDFRRNCTQSFETVARFHSAPYTTFDNLVEVLSFVMMETDRLLQQSRHRAIYLDARKETQRQVYAHLRDRFGLDAASLVRIDTHVVERSKAYGALGIEERSAHFASALRGRLVTDPVAFASVAAAYVLFAYAETIERTLFYERDSSENWVSLCPKCGQPFRTTPLGPPRLLTCDVCAGDFNVTQAYE